MSQFDTLYNNLLEKIESRLNEIIQSKKESRLVEAFEYAVAGGGKRLRPVLALAACGAIGADPMIALDCALAFEIMHNFTLVHDDIMDCSPIRRSKPTLYKKWDTATAIITGDIMIGWAQELLPNINHINSEQIKNVFNTALIEVCEGQALDMELETMKEFDQDFYINMIDKKTAHLLKACSEAGGFCGNGNKDQINALVEFGRDLGLAFQIQDDLLDLISDNSKFGKRCGQDILDGKKTYLIVLALEKLQENQDKLLLNKFLDNRGLNESEIPIIKEIFERTGVIESARNKSDEYLNKAVNSLQILSDNNWKQFLYDLAEYVRVRNH